MLFMASTKKFVHLHTHTHYSLLDGMSKIENLIAVAKKDGMPAIAITDHGNMYGAIEFYKKCKAAGVKPIIGVEAYIANRTRFDKEPNIDNKRYHLILLAKNLTGYKNLIKMVTLANTEGYYYKPRMDKDLLRENSEGLICLSGCFGSELARAIRSQDREKAIAVIREHQEIFGVENYFLEIQNRPNIEGHDDFEKEVISLGRELAIPIVATQDSHRTHEDDKKAHVTLLAVQAGDGGENLQKTFAADDYSFITTEKAYEYFKDIPEAVENTSRIADMCDIEIPLGSWVFPDLRLSSGATYDDELKKLAYEGIEKHGLERTPELLDRLEYELKVIRDKGYSPYFLVVGDLLRFANENGILTNIRGSVAGSLTTYLLEITLVNPLEYKLPFERFLNPERPSAPDIDMDYADNRRDEVIEYARRKYGTDHVAQIGTFGTMMARGAVRDVARALGYPYTVGDRLSKLIPMGSQGFPMTLKHALEITPELKEAYEKEPDAKEIIDLAKKLEGCVRHISVHAAGVVISPTPLSDFTPIQFDPKGGKKLITQYDMHAVEDVGLLKFDFLGIRNLAILADSVRLVKKYHDIDINIQKIPRDDKKTFAMLAKGETAGLFQLNGSGMTKYLMDLRATSIHDINAMVALYRPGPMESIPEYIRRKRNPKLVQYLDPRMKDILDQSYGVITYQDDVMLIAIKIGGYSWLEADKLRKAMGKKIPAEMEAQKEKLLKGFVAGGLSAEKSKELWALIEPFAAYGFNKCLTGDTRILNADTGIPERIDALMKREKTFSVLSLQENKTLAITKSTAPFENGVKKIYRLTTRAGRVIRATDNHPFLAFDGWKRLDKLAIGARIAAPRRLPPPKRAIPLEPYKAATLGYLISEGNLCHPHGIYYYSTQDDEIKDFTAVAEQFPNARMTLDRSKSAASVYVGQTDQKAGNSLHKWLSDLSLTGKTATEKFIPDIIFCADDASLAIFLGKLWQGDGCANVKNQLLYYATSSRRLADDVAHLLLRFGILSTIHTKKFRYRDTYKTGWTVSIQGEENFNAFMSGAGKHLIGAKRKAAETVLSNSRIRTNNRGRGTADTLPAEIFNLLRKKIASYNGTTKMLAQKAGISQRVLFEDTRKRGYPRDTLMRLAVALHSEEIKKHASSDVFWDEVKSIEPDGEEMTYDLTVPTYSNFVANGLIVHNSHAASYGLVAYQTAYMKANFPSEYMAAILTAEAGDVEKVSEIISECKRMEIPVLPPDVNESMGDFAVIKGATGVKDKIRFGLHSVKNLGNEIADAVINEREEKGRYKSYADFLERVQHKNLTKKSLEALIKCGAMDTFGERGAMLFNWEESLAYNKEHGKTNLVQTSLFGLMESAASIPTLRLKDAAAATQKEKLTWEKELLGLYISGHPLDKHKDKLDKREWNNKRIKEEAKDGMPVTIVGIVEEMRDLMTKKNERMAFMKIADYHDSIEVVVFPRTFEAHKEFLALEKCLAIKGKFSSRNGDASVIADVMKVLD